jgi:hypothetical protein
LDERSTCVLSLAVGFDKRTTHYLPQQLFHLGINGRAASKHPLDSSAKTSTDVFQNRTILRNQFSCILLSSQGTEDGLDHSVVNSWDADELGGLNYCYIFLQFQKISRSGSILQQVYTIKLPIETS